MFKFTDAGALGLSWLAPCGSVLFVSTTTPELDAEAHLRTCANCSTTRVK